ncbi:universal stress protein [Reinekea sp.]|jgi:nucleotide-binding universal stress UspA family protein|uniref:universal stress protein n=1 Tax=Reinekea sp. TaxID=1970455 RepID=UPI003989AEFE
MADNNNNERTWTVACIDGSKFNESVSDYSIWLSQALGAPLKALHAIEHNAIAAVSDFSGAIGIGAQEHLLSELTEVEQQRNKLEIQKGKEILDVVKTRAEAAGIENATSTQRHGPLVEALIDLEHETRVVVIGIRGEASDEKNNHLGGHLETIVRSVQRPIFVVNKSFEAPKAAMLAFDGSECSLKALDMVVNSPMFSNLPVHIVNVSKSVSAGEELVAPAKAKLEAAGRTVHSSVLTGDPAQALCQYQKENNIGLTVMGAFSHNRLRDMVFGSFTAKLLLNTEQPLLLLR